MIEFLILGPLEVRDGDRRVDLGGRRQRALLAALLIHAGEPVSADALAQALWGDDAPPTGTKALQVTLSRLRRALGSGGERIETVPGGYRLELELAELDATRFERAYERARELPPAAAVETLRRALGLWRGPALADLRYEPWAQSEIRRLEELRVACLEARVDAELALGGHAGLVGELEALVAEHPSRERLRAQQMLALYRSGRHADALAAYRDARTALDTELGLEPGPELRRLEQAILDHDSSIAAPPAATPGLPPAPPTPTFGREDDVRAVIGALDAARLVTLTGTGGVGKTRLAVDVARAAAGSFVTLASTTDAGRIPALIADALAVATVPGETSEQALDRALERKPTLLVLDNLEQLPDAGPLLAALLERHPALRVLATSREPLRVRAERVFPVAPLAGPAAVELFTDRARARDPGFVPDAPVGEICERLGGVPLAIELAAARLGVLTTADLAERLGDALSLLDQGPRDAPERQRTLRATLDWSFRLLDEEERAAFTALAAFAGGCTLEAAEAVTGAGVAVLERLAAKSLVTAADGRLTMLEPIRQYAAELLAARPDAAAVRGRHLGHYLDLAERCEANVWALARACPEFERLRTEHENLAAAAAWAVEAGDGDRALGLVAALGPYMWFSDQAEEALRWWHRAAPLLGDDVPPRLRGRFMLARAGNSMYDPGRDDAFREAVALFRQIGDDELTARCLVDAAMAATHHGQFERSLELAQQAVEHAGRVGHDALMGAALAEVALATRDAEAALATRDAAAAVPVMAEAARRLRAAGASLRCAQVLASAGFFALVDRPEHAEELAREALEVLGRVDDAWTAAAVHGTAGLAALAAGRRGAARSALVEELVVSHAHGLPMFYFEGLLGLAAVAADQGEDERAAVLQGAAQALVARPIARAEEPVYEHVNDRFIVPARARISREAWERAARRGRAMTADEAIAFALQSAVTAL